MAQHGLSQSKYNLHCCADLQNNADYITHIIVPAFLTSCPTQPIAFLNFDSEKLTLHNVMFTFYSWQAVVSEYKKTGYTTWQQSPRVVAT